MNKSIVAFSFLFFISLTAASQPGMRGGSTTAINPDSITRNLALVVGISSYPNINRLLYADDDANLFADYLVNEKICAKQDVTILIDSVATKANFFKELRKLLDKSQASDRVFIYFAGHGDVENDIESGFLLTYNCEPNNYPATDAIDISMLEKFVAAFTKKNTKVVLITDACRSGNLAGGMSGASSTISSLNKGFQNVIKILSCQPNQLSQEKNYPGGGHGVFTYHLIDGLSGLADKDNDQFISLRELDRYLDEVANETNQQQVPKTEGDPLVRIAAFNQELKLALVASKENRNDVAVVKKNRNLSDSSWNRNIYFQSFNEHIRKSRLLAPEKNNAAYSISEAKRAGESAKMIQEMQLEFAAILEDEAQRFINLYLRGALPTDQKEVLKQLITANEYITALELIIGKNDFRYNEIHVKKLFFDAYTIFKKSEKQKYPLALTYLEEANKLNGNQAWIFNAMGLFYEDLKRKYEALSVYQKAAVLAPQWSYPWNNIGMLYWNQKLYTKAEKSYRKALELDPEYGFAWNGLGNVLDDLDSNDQAIEAYKMSIRYNPHDDDPWNGMGNVLRETGRNYDAMSAYLKAIEIDSMDAYPWTGLGNVYADQEKYAEAETAYQRAIQVDSLFPVAWYNLGVLKENQGRKYEAGECYRIAVSLDSSYADAWSALGSYYDQTNKGEEAVIAYKKALALNPKNADCWNGLGVAYKNLYLYPDAKKAYLAGLAIDSMNYYLWFNIGISYKQEENYNEAANSFKKAVTIDPKSESAWSYLINMLRLGDNKDELLKWYKNKQAAFPEDLQAVIDIGYFYLKQQDFENAKIYFEKSFSKVKESPLPIYRMAQLYAAWNKPEIALQQLESAIQKGYRDFEQIETDTWFENIRNHPAFIKLIKENKNR